MSQSPSEMNDNDAVSRYRQAWSAIYALLENGHSLSGNERNCAFLNLRDGRFVDTSAVCGLDQIDDSRAIAVVDWDFDGRQDLWITNRTAPWLRFQRNDVDTGHHWLSLRLRGNGRTTNSDAIGARVNVTLAGTNETRIRTLRAGDGFLSQSSKWLHFGLGSVGQPPSVVVRWPDGTRETFTGLDADGFFVLTQGSGLARRWEPPRPNIAWKHAPAVIPKSTSQLRVFLASRVPLPELTYEDFEQNRVRLSTPEKRPLLINIWASWCQPCLAELSDWTEHETELRPFDLDVVAICVDRLDDQPQVDRQAAEALISRIEFPWRAGMADHESIAVIQALLRAVIDKPPAISVPSSILVDCNGQVAAVYLGAIGRDRLIADLELLDAPEPKRREHAAHFPGLWVLGPNRSDPAALVRELIAAGQLRTAQRYLTRLSNAGAGDHRTTCEAFHAIAMRLDRQGESDEAIAAFRKALDFVPKHGRVNSDLGIVLMNRKRFAEAAPHLRIALEQNRDDIDARKRLVVALCLSGNAQQALDHARHLVASDRRDPFARLFLAKALRAGGDLDEAIVHYRASFGLVLPRGVRFPAAARRMLNLVETDPSDEYARLFYAKALQSRQRAELAVAEYQKVLLSHPNWVTAQNDLAWLLATHSDANIRDGVESLVLARSACQQTAFKVPAILDTLAAALAENGQFDEAVQTIDQAILLATQQDASALLEQLSVHRSLFLQQQPFRDER